MDGGTGPPFGKSKMYGTFLASSPRSLINARVLQALENQNGPLPGVCTYDFMVGISGILMAPIS